MRLPFVADDRLTASNAGTELVCGKFEILPIRGEESLRNVAGSPDSRKLVHCPKNNWTTQRFAHKGFRFLVPDRQELLNRFLKVFHATKRPYREMEICRSVAPSQYTIS
jgi:hypothetical protein